MLELLPMHVPAVSRVDKPVIIDNSNWKLDAEAVLTELQTVPVKDNLDAADCHCSTTNPNSLGVLFFTSAETATSEILIHNSAASHTLQDDFSIKFADAVNNSATNVAHNNLDLATPIVSISQEANDSGSDMDPYASDSGTDNYLPETTDTSSSETEKECGNRKDGTSATTEKEAVNDNEKVSKQPKPTRKRKCNIQEWKRNKQKD
ncbi:hypothetical protein ILUMI_17304 [Ignelater luminosus]|uniref:Uncharacterized protein n=1 Tax=Ignelater luminosus TaxID=2038154 RepID=A0A8K0G7E5_IGNLU|nr:hypothetical protein ILUMI_17304 [Ignelater luminosus]